MSRESKGSELGDALIFERPGRMCFARTIKVGFWFSHFFFCFLFFLKTAPETSSRDLSASSALAAAQMRNDRRSPSANRTARDNSRVPRSHISILVRDKSRTNCKSRDFPNKAVRSSSEKGFESTRWRQRRWRLVSSARRSIKHPQLLLLSHIF